MLWIGTEWDILDWDEQHPTTQFDGLAAEGMLRKFGRCAFIARRVDCTDPGFAPALPSGAAAPGRWPRRLPFCLHCRD